MKKSVFLGKNCMTVTVSNEGKVASGILVTTRPFIVPNTNGCSSELFLVTKIGRLGVDSVQLHMKAKPIKKIKKPGQVVRIHNASIELLPIIPEWDIFGEYELIQQEETNRSDKVICLFSTLVEEDTPSKQRFLFPDKPKNELDLTYQESNQKIGRQAYLRSYEHSLIVVLNKGAIVRFDRRCMSEEFLREHRIPAVIYYMWTGKELVRQTLEERDKNPQYFSSQKLY